MPAVVAVGHASDVLVVSRVACRAFATPTEFGVWLRETLLRKQAREVGAARAREIQAGLVKQLEVLGQENRALRDVAARVSALEREREMLRAWLRRLSLAAAAAIVILLLIYLASRQSISWLGV